MKKSTLKIIFQWFSIIAILLTIIPILAVDYWWVRAFDFPHLQLTSLTFLAIILYLIKFNFKNYKDYIVLTLLAICFTYQCKKIYPYTTFADLKAGNSSANASNKLKVFTANVLQKNTQYNDFIKLAETVNPDILLLTEVDKKWLNHIKSNAFISSYNYKLEYPLDNTYGMALFSKHQLIDPKVKFLVSDSIPSIHSKVKIANLPLIQLYCVHPTPPMPQENPNSTDRDAELMEIALASMNRTHPTIVIGDFNDVAWSQTSKLFYRVSELLDIRKGRGLYNTFNAENWLMRWPLDHIFVSEEFRVKQLNRGKNISSDHFPYYTELTFEPLKANQQKAIPASKEDIKLAKKQIEKEKAKAN